jgi:hypothetical protein
MVKKSDKDTLMLVSKDLLKRIKKNAVNSERTMKQYIEDLVAWDEERK